jgi:hypothetical protein
VATRLPLVETLTLLASLGSALQTLRGGKQGDDKSSGKDEASAALLLSYDNVKSSQDVALRQDEVATGRMQTLLLVSGAVAAGVVVFSDGAALGSALLIAALVLLGVVAVLAALAAVSKPALLTIDDLISRQVTLPEWEYLRSVLAESARYERTNRRLLTSKATALAIGCLCFAAQVILLAAWAIEG